MKFHAPIVIASIVVCTLQAQARKEMATDPESRVEIVIDKAKQGTSDTAQRLLVYLDGELLFHWKTSTGREIQENNTKSGRKYFSSTDVGRFRFDARIPVGYVSKLWDAPMPLAQFYDNGTAIHAAMPEVEGLLGKRASGGCVRLKRINAEKLYRLVNCFGSNSSAVAVIDGTKLETIEPLRARVTNADSTSNPSFKLNCSTFEDQLVFPDGHTLQCQPIAANMPWEARECGFKKSVAAANGLPVKRPNGTAKADTQAAAEQQRHIDEREMQRPTDFNPK